MSEFSRYVRAVLDRAGREAQRDGSESVEAAHILLAIASAPDTPAGRVLAEAGLDGPVIRDALDREFADSLAAAGVTLADYGLPRPAPRPVPVARFGASARLALERGAQAAGRRAARPAHLLLGVLAAPVGTVPRALALAGVDRAALTARAVAALDTDG